MVPREIAALAAFLTSREGWRRVHYGGRLAWEAEGVVVSIEPDEEYEGVEIWTVEVEAREGRPMIDVDLLGAVGQDED